MQVNKTKFKENISLEYYYVIYVEKTKDPSLSKLSLSNEQKNCALHPNGTLNNAH